MIMCWMKKQCDWVPVLIWCRSGLSDCVPPGLYILHNSPCLALRLVSTKPCLLACDQSSARRIQLIHKIMVKWRTGVSGLMMQHFKFNKRINHECLCVPGLKGLLFVGNSHKFKLIRSQQHIVHCTAGSSALSCIHRLSVRVRVSVLNPNHENKVCQLCHMCPPPQGLGIPHSAHCGSLGYVSHYNTCFLTEGAFKQ